MDQFEHVKDKFGNDMYYGHPEMKLPPHPYVKDHYKHVDILKDIQLRPDDVITISYPKSGQNWTNHLVTMLLEGSTDVGVLGKPDAFIYMDVTGWDMQLPPPVKPRALWSHLPFRYLPRDVEDKKVKLVFITRNLKDVIVSHFCFFKNFTLPMGYEGTWPQFCSHIMEEGHYHGDMFDYLLDWEKDIAARPDHPILQVAYEDLIKDPVGQVQRLNEFLGTERSEEFCRQVAHTCRFSNMHVTRRFYSKSLKNANWRDDVPQSLFWRKGVIGDWKNWFTVAQNEQFEEIYRTKMAGSKLKFTYD